jgi:hypothetical protein
MRARPASSECAGVTPAMHAAAAAAGPPSLLLQYRHAADLAARRAGFGSIASFHLSTAWTDRCARIVFAQYFSRYD